MPFCSTFVFSNSKFLTEIKYRDKLSALIDLEAWQKGEIIAFKQEKDKARSFSIHLDRNNIPVEQISYFDRLIDHIFIMTQNLEN